MLCGARFPAPRVELLIGSVSSTLSYIGNGLSCRSPLVESEQTDRRFVPCTFLPPTFTCFHLFLCDDWLRMAYAAGRRRACMRERLFATCVLRTCRVLPPYRGALQWRGFVGWSVVLPVRCFVVVVGAQPNCFWLLLSSCFVVHAQLVFFLVFFRQIEVCSIVSPATEVLTRFPVSPFIMFTYFV